MTDEHFEEMVRPVFGALSKKQETAPENESVHEQSERERHHLKSQKTANFAKPKAADGQISERRRIPIHVLRRVDEQVANESNVELAASPRHPTETNGQQPIIESGHSVLNQVPVNKTERVAVLEVMLAEADRRAASAERRAENYKRKKDEAKQRLKSQVGQLRAAERRVRELTGVLQRQQNSLKGQLKKVHRSKRELRAEGRIEALLMDAGVDGGGEGASFDP